MAHHNRGRGAAPTVTTPIGETTKQTVGRHKPSAKNQQVATTEGQQQQSLVSRRSTTSGLSLPGKGGPMTKGGPRSPVPQAEEELKTQAESQTQQQGAGSIIEEVGASITTSVGNNPLDVEFDSFAQLMKGLPPTPQVMFEGPNKTSQQNEAIINLDIDTSTTTEVSVPENNNNNNKEEDVEMEEEEEEEEKTIIAPPVREKRVEPAPTTTNKTSKKASPSTDNKKRKVVQQEEESSEEEGEEGEEGEEREHHRR